MSLPLRRRLHEVPAVRIGSTTTTRFVAPSAVTGGDLGLFHHSMDPGAPGATPHVHHGFNEAFYVLGGTVDLYDGTGWAPAGPGTFLHVPVGAPHGFRNVGDERAEMLILFTPGGDRESYFRELSELLDGRPVPPGAMADLMARHDQTEVHDITIEEGAES